MRERTQLTCITCKDIFYPKGGHLKQLNCSRECGFIYRNRNGSPRKGKSYPHLYRADIRKCRVCNKDFRAVKDFKDYQQKYCSKACWNIRGTVTVLKRNCPMCSVQFLTWDKRKIYCGNKCSWNRKEELTGPWKGDSVSYSGLHKWVASRLGKPMECSKCGYTSDNPKDIHWANKSQEYKRDLTDWIRLCAKCHFEYDKGKHTNFRRYPQKETA